MFGRGFNITHMEFIQTIWSVRQTPGIRTRMVVPRTELLGDAIQVLVSQECVQHSGVCGQHSNRVPGRLVHTLLGCQSRNLPPPFPRTCVGFRFSGRFGRLFHCLKTFGSCCFVFRVSCLVFGVWCLVFGVRCLVFGVRCSVFGVWCLVFGVLGLVFGA